MQTSVKTRHGTALYSSENVITELEVAIPNTWPPRTTTIRFWVDDEDPTLIRTNSARPMYIVPGRDGTFGIKPVYQTDPEIEGEA
jgi:hypothetical protein